jgi:hypothetical protein
MAITKKDLMGYFENLAEAGFKQGTNGEFHFNRWGVFGKPYIVPSAERKAEVKTFITKFYRVGLPLAILSGIFLKLMAVPILAVILIYYEVRIRKEIKGWKRTDEKLTLHQSYANTAKIFSPAFLWFGAIVSVLFVLCGALMVWKTDKLWQGGLGVVFFGLCAAAYSKMLLERYRVTKRSGSP